MQRRDKEEHAEESVDERGDPRERLGGEADDGNEAVAFLGVLGQVDGAADPQRGRDQQREDHRLHGGDDGREQMCIRDRSQPGAPGLLAAALVHPVEALKNPFQVLGRDADPGVGYLQQGTLLLLRCLLYTSPGDHHL